MMTISSLYRTYLRQVRALPHIHLRHFWGIKGADDFRSVLNTKSDDLCKRKLRRVFKDLQRLRAANAGQSVAFDRMLDIAYGRVGKLRWELIEPLLLNSTSLLPQTNSTCSPAYSPELAALLTSGASRATRALQKHHLLSPPCLPERGKSNSEDAMLLGPLSRRREHNIRWRFFKAEQRKVYPSLEISLHHPANHIDTSVSSEPVVNFGFQGVGTLQELLALAGPPSRLPGPQDTSRTNPFDGSLPVRWLRRRYQALLGRLPLLVLRSSPQDESRRAYDVRLADNVITASRIHSLRLRELNAQDVPWINDVHLVQPRTRGR